MSGEEECLPSDRPDEPLRPSWLLLHCDGPAGWDADKNGQLTEDEFNAGIGERREAFNTRFTDGAYGEWDADDNGYLTDDQFGDGVCGAYDDDDDNVIEESEFGNAGDDMGDGGLFDV